MLTEDQITSVWERLLASEVRALYFGELASRYTVQKQWISGLSFFLASSAAATIVAKSPVWLPIFLACTTAVLSAYSVARGLDGATRTMSRFQFAWGELAAGYELCGTPLGTKTQAPDSLCWSLGRMISRAKPQQRPRTISPALITGSSKSSNNIT